MSEKTIVAIDATELNNFELCHYKWHLTHQRHIRSAVTPEPLDKGTLIHEIFKVYYNLKISNPTMPHEQMVETAISQGQLIIGTLALEAENCEEMFFQAREYFKHYEYDTWEPLLVEKVFAVSIYDSEDLQIIAQGIIDCLMRIKEFNKPCIVDHKTRSRRYEDFDLNNQFMLYAMCMGLDTVIINKVGFQKTLKPAERFTRQIISYSQSQLAEFHQDIVNDVREIVKYSEMGYFPRNRTSCTKYNGCNFQQWCVREPEGRESLIGLKYVISDVWDVGKKLEEQNSKEI